MDLSSIELAAAAATTPRPSTAAGLARRFDPVQPAGMKTTVGRINARTLGPVRRSALRRRVTIEIGTTDIEVC